MRALAAICAALALTPCVAMCAQAPHASGPVAIFMYHHVSPSVLPGRYGRALTVTPLEFHDQLAWLQAHGCRVVSVDVLYDEVEQGTLGRCEAALTFDDGYADAATYALPLLRAFGDPATFYVATGYVGTRGHLSLVQLRELRSAGMEIGAHTVHHVDLTKLSHPLATAEVDASVAELRAWLGIPITTFAYPAGRFDAPVVASMRDERFATAVTTQPGHVVAASDRYELPRYRVVHGSGLHLLATVFRGGPVSSPPQPELAHIARERIAGNAPDLAEGIAVALLARSFPEQIMKVHVLALAPTCVAGIVLSGVKFHEPVDRARFEADVTAMVEIAFAQAPNVDEVDVWATVPTPVRAGAPVSGDYAVPTSKTVFSAAVTRDQADTAAGANLGTTYWDPDFLR